MHVATLARLLLFPAEVIVAGIWPISVMVTTRTIKPHPTRGDLRYGESSSLCPRVFEAAMYLRCHVGFGTVEFNPQSMFWGELSRRKNAQL